MSSMTNRVVWIASYPKSGNTWVRFLCSNLLHGRQESAACLGELVPDIHELDRTDGAAPAGFLKTHFPFTAALPFAVQTAAAIYVVRAPADVLASNFFYSQRSALSPLAFDDYVDAFVESRGDPRWLELGMGSWESNVSSWLQVKHPFPVLRIRYEDMVEDPLSACRSIAQLIRPESSAAEMAEAVKNSSFQRMRDVERADIRERRVGIFYKPYLQASIDAGSRFMRRGLVGDGTARLSPGQRLRVNGAFAPLLRELGYAS